MRIFSRVRMLTLLFAVASMPALAKHGAPARIEPIVHQGVRYVVPNDKGLRAYIEAWDMNTERRLWTKTVFRHWYIPPFGTECMHYEYISTMTLKGDQLMLTSERGRDYSLDVRTRAVRRTHTKRPNQSASVSRRYRLPLGVGLEFGRVLHGWAHLTAPVTELVVRHLHAHT